MSLSLITLSVTEVLVRLTEQGPEPEDVKAGWTAFAMFLLLGAAVVVLGLSLVKQLRRAQAARDAGAFGDEPVTDEVDPEDPSSR
ncbi:hypothetical protein [Nocardioides sp.]|uniref:hypothetical protein n=1 Tax=Nocardioides sp. TaxID=35761 RepID=UPI00356A674D